MEDFSKIFDLHIINDFAKFRINFGAKEIVNNVPIDVYSIF